MNKYKYIQKLSEALHRLPETIRHKGRTLRLSVCPNSVEYKSGSKTIMSFDGPTTLDAIEQANASIKLADLKER